MRAGGGRGLGGGRTERWARAARRRQLAVLLSALLLHVREHMEHRWQAAARARTSTSTCTCKTSPHQHQQLVSPRAEQAHAEQPRTPPQGKGLARRHTLGLRRAANRDSTCATATRCERGPA